MQYTLKEIKKFNTYSDDTAFLKELNNIQIEQLKMALLPHVSLTNGDLTTFKNCFFPVYANNEGGVEKITFYEVLNGDNEVVYDFIKVDVTAGTFFNHNTNTITTSVWANEFEVNTQKNIEIDSLIDAWKAMQR